MAAALMYNSEAAAPGLHSSAGEEMAPMNFPDEESARRNLEKVLAKRCGSLFGASAEVAGAIADLAHAIARVELGRSTTQTNPKGSSPDQM